MASGLLDPTTALAGQQHAIMRLDALAANPPQSIVLEGGDADERFAAALWWAMRLNCESGQKPCDTCPACRQIRDRAFSDLMVFDGREDLIKVEPIREARPIWGQPPHGDGYRVTILAEAQRLMTESANALLKSLEEPRPGNVFVLCTPQRERLLETLVSRSFVVTLSWPNAQGNDADIEEWCAAMVGFWKSGRGWFPRTATKGSVDADLAFRVLLGMQRVLRDAMSGSGGKVAADMAAHLGTAGLRRLDLALGEAQDALNTQVPVNPSLVLDWLATRLRA